MQISMSKTIFLLSVLCIFISCTTKSHIAVVKDMPTDTMQMGESSRFKIDDNINIVEQIADDSIRRNNTSPRQIYHEQPKLSADSLAALRVLWDSIISNPLLGYVPLFLLRMFIAFPPYIERSWRTLQPPWLQIPYNQRSLSRPVCQR